MQYLIESTLIKLVAYIEVTRKTSWANQCQNQQHKFQTFRIQHIWLVVINKYKYVSNTKTTKKRTTPNAISINSSLSRDISEWSPMITTISWLSRALLSSTSLRSGWKLNFTKLFVQSWNLFGKLSHFLFPLLHFYSKGNIFVMPQYTTYNIYTLLCTHFDQRARRCWYLSVSQSIGKTRRPR